MPPKDLLGEGGLLKELTKRLAERVLETKMTMHLGYEKHDPIGNNSGNSRNGTTNKNVPDYVIYPAKLKTHWK